MTGGILVVVQREWNGWRTALASLDDLEDIRWLQPDGAPRPLIHAYLLCTRLQSGDLPHDCDASSGPHRLLVCVLKCHTAPGVFEALSSRASEGGLDGKPRPFANDCTAGPDGEELRSAPAV
jgi:hypothetical protein